MKFLALHSFVEKQDPHEPYPARSELHADEAAALLSSPLSQSPKAPEQQCNSLGSLTARLKFQLPAKGRSYPRACESDGLGATASVVTEKH